MDPDLVSTDSFFGDSLLAEIGVKLNAFDEMLFVSIAVFEQERQSLSLQGPTNNQATRSEGFEFEVRGLVAEGFSVAAVYSNYEISVFEEGGYTFTYLGVSNFPDVEPDKVVEVIDYEHTIFTQSTLEGQDDLQGLQGSNNTYYTGAHLGFGFHEDGLQSALRVVKWING